MNILITFLMMYYRPPYYIGKQQFDDYTIFQLHLQPIKQLYIKLYGNKSCKTIHGLAESEPSQS